MLVKDRMERAVIAVRPETTLIDTLRLMREHTISTVPVSDQQGAFLGRVTKTMILRELHESGEVKPRTAGEVMDRVVSTVRSSDPLEKALFQMVENCENSLPVVDSARLVGILTRQDLIACSAGNEGF